MAHQFLCPRGHLLQADESSGGSQCRCPHCGILFIIPPPAGRPAAAAPDQAENIGDNDSPIEPFWEGATDSKQDSERFVNELFADAPPDEVEEEPVEALAGASSLAPDELLPVVCPKGHRLQAPRRMIGHEVVCTVCSRRFTLTEKHTWAYIVAKAEQTAARERRVAQIWLRWAITAAVLVVGTLVTLIVLSRFR